jgi:hypothetical protein
METTITSDICPVCAIDPTSHSLKKIDIIQGIHIYYTCPAKSTKYDDCDGIITHYTNEFDTIGNEPWIWIIDSSEYDYRHLLNIRIGIALVSLVQNKYMHNLKRIHVINTNYFLQIVYNALSPFINAEFKKLIEFE